jgi:hypothetical protein
MDMEKGIKQRQVLSLLFFSFLCSFPSISMGSGLSYFKRRFCDDGYPFPTSEDQCFVEMLDNLLDVSRSSLAGIEVSAKDRLGRFEGTAGCLWHNCQIYDGECYPCHSTRDAEACIETVIEEVKQNLHESSRYESGFCGRTREFATGEKSVAANDASTTFQVCGMQYKFFGQDLALGRRGVY